MTAIRRYAVRRCGIAVMSVAGCLSLHAQRSGFSSNHPLWQWPVVDVVELN